MSVESGRAGRRARGRPGAGRAHGLTEDEFRPIERWLGRTPTFTELGVFSVMWSEHCSYKSSRRHLRQASEPQSPRVAGGPGENAGALDIGDGWVAVFKIESHNHPSFVEPYQGAATGVGGILRDIFAMGARPVASMDSLKFGSFDHPRTRYLLGGVVGGIGGYGNCVGVPTVGGEVMFDDAYNGNILVNAFCLGLARRERIAKRARARVGNPVLYVGSATGRDGIHGASLLASAEFDASSEAKRPTVQVGDPFTEKLLIEACLEAMQTGAVVAIQDMGAAGLTSSSSEMAARGGLGIEIDLDRSSATRGGTDALRDSALGVAGADADRCGARARGRTRGGVREVGSACGGGRQNYRGRRWRVRWRGKLVADIPAAALADEAPVYERPAREPSKAASTRSAAASAASTSKPGPARRAGRRRPRPCAVCSILPTSAPSDGFIGSTTRSCKATRWPGRAATPPCSGSRERIAPSR